MSEYTRTITLCDRCYPEDLPAFTFFELEEASNVFRGSTEEAIDKGWGERDYGIACPNCVAKEKAEAEDGEVVLGEQALQTVLGSTPDLDDWE